MLMKQIAVMKQMMTEDREEVEKHLLNEQILDLYRAKLKQELSSRMATETP